MVEAAKASYPGRLRLRMGPPNVFRTTKTGTPRGTRKAIDEIKVGDLVLAYESGISPAGLTCAPALRVAGAAPPSLVRLLP